MHVEITTNLKREICYPRLSLILNKIQYIDKIMQKTQDEVI